MSKKLTALLLAAMMLLSLAAACGKDPAPAPTQPAATQPAATQPAATQPAATEPAAQPKVFNYYQSKDADTLYGATTSYSENELAISLCSGYLYRQVPNDDGMGFHFEPDLAAEEPKQIDELTWQIPLRQEAKFHNGDPINADTWIFTFQEIINPKLGNALASFLYKNYIEIVNAENYFFQGTEGYPATVAWEEVGIKKIDDYTIEINVTTPISANDIENHFIMRCMAPIHPETYKACMSADGLTTTYGTSLDTWVGCGPYFFDTWTYESLETFKKNEDHWMADWYNYDVINLYIIPEENPRVQMFESGELDYLAPSTDVRDNYMDDPRMITYPSLYIMDYDLNTRNSTNPLSGNNNYEKALYHAIDRETIATQVLRNMEPAGWYVNGQAGSLSESGLCYRDSEYGNKVEDLVNSWSAEGEICGFNPDLAYDYLMKAYADVGLSEDTVVHLKSLHTETSVSGRPICEFLMAEFERIFKGKLVIDCTPCAPGTTLTIMETMPDSWDFTFQDWGRSVSRKLPYEVYHYHRESYTGRPTHTYTDAFEAQFQACANAAVNESYERVLEETMKLEIQALEDVINIPLYQGVNFELISDRIELPMKQYVPGFGWGIWFADIVE